MTTRDSDTPIRVGDRFVRVDHDKKFHAGTIATVLDVSRPGRIVLDHKTEKGDPWTTARHYLNNPRMYKYLDPVTADDQFLSNLYGGAT